MNAKKYVLTLTLFLYGFMVLNLAMWFGLTGEIFTMKDMNRMGSEKTLEALTQDIHYAKHHTELAEYITSGRKESFDVLTLGDSFSNGRNNYQDYLVDHYGLKVINTRVQNNCLDDIYLLLNAGIVDELKPSVIILESVERSVQARLGVVEIIPKIMTREEIVRRLQPANAVSKRISSGIFPPVLVQWNFTFFYNKIYRILYPEKLSPEVYITSLDRPFFTNTGQETTLMHYWEDLEYLKQPLDAEMVNRNLNNAASLLKAKGIKLIFFAAADKYDLYYPYIVDKKGRSENTFFQKMRSLQGKEYVFVDALKPLREALAKGEQDVYWLGDTHWSWKGVKYFCDELVKHIIR